MKIIKKLCIPLFSLVLVLGCFAVSQMDASAASGSPRFCFNFYEEFGNGLCRNCNLPFSAHPTTAAILQQYHRYCNYAHGVATGKEPCSCTVYTKSGWDNMQLCANCGHSLSRHDLVTSSAGGNSHTHNYSTAWGGWRKISACRLPG